MTDQPSPYSTKGASPRADDPDRERGLYGKFRVHRTDGSTKPGGKHEHCFFFVLDVHHDPHARAALAAYANAVQHGYPQLSRDLFDILRQLPPEPAVDQVPRPTSDGRPDAVPPLIASEAIGAFCGWLRGTKAPGRRQLVLSPTELTDAAVEFVNRQGLEVPRRGWQQIVKQAHEAGR